MPEYDPVQKISIVPRGQAGGLTFFAPSEERLESGLYSKSYLENQVRSLSPYPFHHILTPSKPAELLGASTALLS